RAVSGISAAVWVVMSVLFGGYFAPEYRVKALTILNACNLFGQMIASLIAIPVTAKYGISSTFLIAAAGGLIALLISFTLKEKKFDRKPLSLKNLLAVGRSKWVLMISAMCILSQLMFFATTSGFTPQLALALGSAPSTLGWIQLISTAGGAAFSFLSPRLFVDRFGALNTVVVLLALQAVSCLIQPLAGTLNLLLLIIFINGIARGTAVSLMLGLITIPFPYETQAAAMGIYQAFYALGITLGPTIAGAAMEIGGLARGFYVVGSLGLIAPVIGIFLIREKNALLEAAE
ncbi:MAG: MFS transporter, partial [Ruminococcaceae bacterium]|nr:MFS transporter [Oscillospiraceae bacterium]